MTQTTRRQHYVWKKYLEPWAERCGGSRKVWCLRRNSRAAFHTDTKNVAVERHFYRLSEFRSEDADFVRFMAFIDSTRPQLRELNERWITIFETFWKLQRLAREHPNASQPLLGKLDKQLIEYQENRYCSMENGAIDHLDALVAGDIRFFDDDQAAAGFCNFLAHQYFRTKAMRDRIEGGFANSPYKEIFNRTWPIFRHILATNVGLSVFAERAVRKLQVIRAAQGMTFITSDQPVINTYGAFMAPMENPTDTEFFYPVSPDRAVIISGQPDHQDLHDTQVSQDKTDYFNHAVMRVAHEQLFARSEADLAQLRFSFCKLADDHATVAVRSPTT